MTSLTASTMPPGRQRKRARRLRRYFARPGRRVVDRSLHATHIVVSRGSVARARSTQVRYVRLAIWLAGWHIEIYEELGEQPGRFNR